MVRLLLSRGANINACDKRDRRAIHWAAYMGEKWLKFPFFYIFFSPDDGSFKIDLIFISWFTHRGVLHLKPAMQTEKFVGHPTQ